MRAEFEGSQLSRPTLLGLQGTARWTGWLSGWAGLGMSPVEGDISTAPGSALWINPNSIAGAKPKEAGLARSAVGSLRTLSPSSEHSHVSPCPALPLSPAWFRADGPGHPTAGSFLRLGRTTLLSFSCPDFSTSQLFPITFQEFL